MEHAQCIFPDSGKLFANVDSFLHAALWSNQEHQFRQATHPLTLLLQNFDADILETHGLHWQQS